MANRARTWGAALAGAAALLGAGYYTFVRRPLAQTEGTIPLAGLERPVEVFRDMWGVPHIYADSLVDLLFAQGFVHAQDRLWQMEFQRRVLTGRLAELLGAEALPLDRWLRTLTMSRVAEAEAALLGAEARASLEAYAAGVNARIAQGRLPIEFTLLRHRPEPWSVVDCLAWAKMIAWMLSVNWEAELLRARLIEHLGPERAAELEPPYRPEWPTIVPRGIDSAAANALDRAAAAQRFTGPSAFAGLGSNSWVLAGARTRSGAPLLANDMHLPMNMPCIWYENHLAAPDLEVSGVSLPGVPGVVAGHNHRVAWGFTMGFADVQDLYLEHLRRTEDGRVEVEFRGEWGEAQVLREEIPVRGGEAALEEVIVTPHGPVINALAPGLAAEGQPLALRWTSLDPDPQIDALLQMMRAGSAAEFHQALRGWASPVLNVVYADVEGNIGYTLAGKVPIRARGDGRVPVPGWSGEYEWAGMIPFDEVPHLVNPPQGYVATANNCIAGDDYPHFLGGDYALSARAQRIAELIEAAGQLDLDGCQRMQFDQVSLYGREVAAHLGRLEVTEPELAAVVALMREWDGTLSAESPAAAVVQVFARRLLRLALSDRLGDLADRYLGQGPTPTLAEASIFGRRACEWLLAALDGTGAARFDPGQDHEELLRQALRQSVEFLKAELGPRPEDWAWGKLHTLTYSHLLGRFKLFDRFLNRGPYPVGGDATTLWATGSALQDLNSDVIVGPPFRSVVDLGDLDKSVGLLAPGQSGQPGSPHYDDQIQAWFQGDYHPLLFARAEVERRAQHRLLLLPRSRSAD